MNGTSFRHLAPASRIFFGDDSLGQLKAELQRAGCGRAVVFCGRTLARSEPGLETIRKALGELCVGVFAEVAEQSPLPIVEAGAEALRRFDADAVVALGGGSAIVTARAASIVAAEGKDVRDLATAFAPGRPPVSPKLSAPKALQFIVPTTPTTAYAKAGSGVSAPNTGARYSLFDPKTRAHAIFFAPALFCAAPATLVRDASLDCLALGIQGLESIQREPLADALLLHGLRLIRRSLPNMRVDPAASRGALMLAAMLIGQGTDFTGSGLASALGHTIGARCKSPNGLVKAVVLPHTIRFNAIATSGRLGDAAEALGAAGGAETAEHLIGACATLFTELGLPSRLRDLGVAQEDLPRIAEEAVNDFFFFQNPRPVADGELIKLLRAAW